MAKLLVFGCGNMGGAVVKGILDHELVLASDCLILERFPNEYTQAFQADGARLVESANEVTEQSQMVLLAVKPQDSAQAMAELKPLLAENALVISVMAGIGIQAMQEALGEDKRVIRSMPNTPAAIHLGMTAYVGGANLSEDDYQLAQSIFSAFGKALRLKDESMIDAATAISGSGPAYVFFLAESLAQGAREMGFSAEEAELLATQTLLGASSLLSESEESAATLRAKVTSKGGTTEAALKSFAASGIQEALIEGFKAARDRGRELGG